MSLSQLLHGPAHRSELRQDGESAMITHTHEHPGEVVSCGLTNRVVPLWPAKQ
jgi:hypothetical protein